MKMPRCFSPSWRATGIIGPGRSSRFLPRSADPRSTRSPPRTASGSSSGNIRFRRSLQRKTVRPSTSAAARAVMPRVMKNSRQPRNRPSGPAPSKSSASGPRSFHNQPHASAQPSRRPNPPREGKMPAPNQFDSGDWRPGQGQPVPRHNPRRSEQEQPRTMQAPARPSQGQPRPAAKQTPPQNRGRRASEPSRAAHEPNRAPKATPPKGRNQSPRNQESPRQPDGRSVPPTNRPVQNPDRNRPPRDSQRPAPLPPPVQAAKIPGTDDSHWRDQFRARDRTDPAISRWTPPGLSASSRCLRRKAAPSAISWPSRSGSAARCATRAAASSPRNHSASRRATCR